MPNWTPAVVPPFSAIAGTFCRVEPTNIDAHLEDLFEAFSGDASGGNTTYLPYGPFKSVDELQGWMEKTCLSKDPMFHTIIDLKTDKAVGIAALMRIAPSIGVIEVGHVHYSPRLQRTPIATEAMFLLMQRVFDELGYRRFEWKCDSLNAPSCKAAERYGFQFEGTFRQALVYRGRNRDTNWFSIIDQEWPAIKQAYITWLSSNNFDDNGQQKTRLTTR